MPHCLAKFPMLLSPMEKNNPKISLGLFAASSLRPSPRPSSSHHGRLCRWALRGVRDTMTIAGDQMYFPNCNGFQSIWEWCIVVQSRTRMEPERNPQALEPLLLLGWKAGWISKLSQLRVPCLQGYKVPLPFCVHCIIAFTSKISKIQIDPISLSSGKLKLSYGKFPQCKNNC